MGIALAAGFEVLGLLRLIDHAAAAQVASGDVSDLAPAVSPGFLWSATVVLAFAIACVILTVPQTWRRVVVWVSTMVAIAGWLPVAAIAHQHASIAAPLTATAWSGLGALIYAARHRMKVDDAAATHAPSNPPDVTD